MKNFLLYIWQLPQNILGLIVIFFSKAKRREMCAITYFETSINMGVSLGKYIILNEGFQIKDLMHEYGHQKQSLYLGWLYLLIIGLPSAVFNNLWDRVFHKKWGVYKRYKWYYSRFPENWADKLGGIKIRP